MSSFRGFENGTRIIHCTVVCRIARGGRYVHAPTVLEVCSAEVPQTESTTLDESLM